MTRSTQFFDALHYALRLENAIVFVFLFALAKLTHSLLLRQISKERHQLLRLHFGRALWTGIGALISLGLFLAIDEIPVNWRGYNHLVASVGLVSFAVFLIWAFFVIRVLIFVGAFLLQPKVPVPLLLINVISIVIGLGMGLFAATDILGLSLAPLLATSAIASVVLGLALQETLGNLFSGIALQFDRPFRIDDWVEITHSGGKVSGVVKEISWRATVLVSLTDELIILPNRMIAGAQVANFTFGVDFISRSQVFNLPFDADFRVAERALQAAVSEIRGVLNEPKAKLYVTRNCDSWTECKLIYAIRHYVDSAKIGDEVLRAGLRSLQQQGIKLALPTNQWRELA